MNQNTNTIFCPSCGKENNHDVLCSLCEMPLVYTFFCPICSMCHPLANTCPSNEGETIKQILDKRKKKAQLEKDFEAQNGKFLFRHHKKRAKIFSFLTFTGIESLSMGWLLFLIFNGMNPFSDSKDLIICIVILAIFYIFFPISMAVLAYKGNTYKPSDENPWQPLTRKEKNKFIKFFYTTWR